MIKNYRLNKGLTQKELAKKVGISEPMIAKIENNTYLPNLKTFKRLIDVLNIKDKDIINYIKKGL